MGNEHSRGGLKWVQIALQVMSRLGSISVEKSLHLKMEDMFETVVAFESLDKPAIPNVPV